ncbi:MAG TPA: beta-propeller fold lactonase family protein, partial [Candidatus Angelobacter sp.]|nr:beta-propeller fold lactonase family protein [Candidatus Angelobacter sp.]
ILTAASRKSWVSPFATGDNGQNGTPFSLAVTTLKEKNYLYAANGADGTISGFKIDPATGSLQAVPGSPFATNNQAANYSLAISPDNRFLFVASDGAALIHVFRISQGTGELREVHNGPFQVSTSFSDLNVSTNGRFLLAGGSPSGGIFEFQISKDGTLTEASGSPFPASGGVDALATSCSGNLVFAAGFQLIDVFSLGPNGSLTPVPGSPFSDGQANFDVLLSPDNRFLFSSGGFSQTVAVFAVSPNGSLSPVAGSPFSLPDFTAGLATTSNGGFLYTALFISNTVDGERVAPNGILTPAPNTPFITGQHPITGLMESVAAFPAPSCSRH